MGKLWIEGVGLLLLVFVRGEGPCLLLWSAVMRALAFFCVRLSWRPLPFCVVVFLEVLLVTNLSNEKTNLKKLQNWKAILNLKKNVERRRSIFQFSELSWKTSNVVGWFSGYTVEHWHEGFGALAFFTPLGLINFHTCSYFDDFWLFLSIWWDRCQKNYLEFVLGMF